MSNDASHLRESQYRVLCLGGPYVSFSRPISKVNILDKIHDRRPDDFGRFHDFS